MPLNLFQKFLPTGKKSSHQIGTHGFTTPVIYKINI